MTAIQSSSIPRPDAILFEPAGSTALPQVARAAAAAGIGWVILNREADYVNDLRRQLYDLYHLLNHLNLFGGGYLGQVQATLARLKA